MNLSLIGDYGSFLEVAFALNLISTWEGLYRSLTAQFQRHEAEASSDRFSQALVASLGEALKWLRRISRASGLSLSILIFLFLLYGLPESLSSEGIVALLWVCGGVVPALAAMQLVMVRYYYPSLRSIADKIEQRTRTARAARERARAELEEEILARAEEEGRIRRLDQGDDSEVHG